jgi:hypothetical protein
MVNNRDINDIEVTLISDKEWSIIDAEFCRVVDFSPLGASIKNGQVITANKVLPYATITIECRKFPTYVKGYIYHKIDFQHLWAAFKERTIKQDEEVLIFWSKKHYKSYVKVLSAFMPRLWVMIFPKEAYELMTDKNYKQEMSTSERIRKTSIIIDWKPNVMI